MPLSIIEARSSSHAFEDQNHSLDPRLQGMSQLSSFGRQMVKFIEHTAFQEVPYEREAVNNKAREYAIHKKAYPWYKAVASFGKRVLMFLLDQGTSPWSCLTLPALCHQLIENSGKV